MPNWCDNTLELIHDDPAMIERAKKAFLNMELLQEFCPVPQELKDTRAGCFGKDTYAQELLEATEKLNLKWFKHKNWYDYCVNEWGTKWDVGGDDGIITNETPNSLTLSFQSAWSPPTDAYRKMEDLGFTISAYYYEGGCAFCGRYGAGYDDCYSIDCKSYWVKENIPEDIDEMFCISESMAEWEDENARPIHMRKDLAEQGLTIPAGLSWENYDDLKDVIHLSAQDLEGAVEYDTGEDPDSHAFCPAKLADGRIVYLIGADLEWFEENEDA